MTDRITIRRPDDWHVHLRDGAMLAAVLPATAAQFARAIVMPNLVPPVRSAADARSYRDRILAALPQGADFTPLMVCYLTDETDASDLAAGIADGSFVAAKLYPSGATTNSHAGVTDVRRIDGALAVLAKTGAPLLVHGEVTDHAIDVFDREAVFLDRVLAPLLARHHGLRVVMEHATTREAVAFVRAHAPRVAATITAHHLIINRNALFQGGLRPHHYCLPVAKREVHRLALREAAISGEAAFFLGTDSAPHPVSDKEMDCGCAGIFTALAAMELYTEVFAEEGRLDRLESFASLNGPAFYRLPPNEARVTLERRQWTLPKLHKVAGGSGVVPFRAGDEVGWALA
ncbi:MAG: dihydroorotase [Alphaproteobacteria bacterium]|nr:dihydroorotase [Alphaproteobacteria bacterium]